MDKDKFIVEALGHCWHEWVENKGHQSCNEPIMCDKCWNYPGEGPPNPDLTTWEGFGWLWDEMVKREDWDKFKESTVAEGYSGYDNCGLLRETYINPTRFRDAVYDFLQEQGDERNSPS